LHPATDDRITIRSSVALAIAPISLCSIFGDLEKIGIIAPADRRN
jgi:hypothetical protein